MDLFDAALDKNTYAPLADRMRPQTLDDIVGQDHLLGDGKVLRSLIQQDQLRSVIFWGPPGVGKTTIASVIAGHTGAFFIPLSAVNVGVKEVRSVIEKARDQLKYHHKKTIVFLDEIHRFNKAQQDALLPAVEQGIIILIGATTENPSFEVNSALLSRSRVFILKELEKNSLELILNRACELLGIDSISQEAQEVLCGHANGDARSLLNILEFAYLLVQKNTKKEINLPIIEEAIQQKALRYDKAGEEHYNVISAFIKSMRNSDANAALYWLGRMIEAGEDPLFIARRMVVFASEDIGLADAQAIQLATSVFQAVHAIGMPEGRIPLGHCAVYLSQAPKNNTAYCGIEAALKDAREFGNLPVPLHLRNAVTKLMKEIEYGKGYKYAHDFKDQKIDMQCMPDELKDKKYL